MGFGGFSGDALRKGFDLTLFGLLLLFDFVLKGALERLVFFLEFGLVPALEV